MDQSISLSRKELNPQQENHEKSKFSRIYTHTVKLDLEIEKRGDITAVIELTNPSSQDYNLPQIADDLFKAIVSEYYSNHHGSPLEAIEHAIESAHNLNTTQTNNVVNLAVGAFGLWGKTLIFDNHHNAFIGIRREHEFIELDEPNIGSHLLKDGDLILISSKDFGQQALSHLLREQQKLSNDQLRDHIINTYSSNTERAFAPICHFTSVLIDSVPSEEEIIEITPLPIAEPSTFSQLGQQFRHLFLKKNQQPPPSRGKDDKTQQSEPQIYLRNNSKSKKKQKLALLTAVLLLLAGSIYYTYSSNTTQEQSLEEELLLDQVRQDISRANELADLNQSEAKSHVESAIQNIEAVLGAREDLATERQQLLSETTQIFEKIYKAQNITLENKQEESGVTRNFATTETSVTSGTSSNIIALNPDWGSGITVDSYLSNIYILSPQNSAIWKFTNLLQQPGNTTPVNYIRDNSDLSTAIDLSIDGSIFVLHSNRIDQYVVGEKTNFSISGVRPEFNDQSQIAVTENNPNIYVSSPEGIQVFDKDGLYQRLLILNQQINVTNLVLSEDGKILYIINGSDLFLVNLEQL